MPPFCTMATLQASHVSLMLLIGLLVTVSAVAYGVGFWGGVRPEGLARWMIPGNGLVLVANAVLGCIMLSELARWALSLALLKRLLTYAARAIRRKLFTQAVKIGLSKRATWNKPHAQKLTRTAIRKSNSFKIISLF